MKKILTALLLSAALGLSGCQSTEQGGVVHSGETSSAEKKTAPDPAGEPRPEEKTDVYQAEEYTSRPLTSGEFSAMRDSFSALSLCSETLIALTEDKNVLVWGYGYNGKIGNGFLPPRAVYRDSSRYQLFTPYLIDFSENIVSVGGDNLLAYALTESGDVYVWGKNDFGACGLEPGDVARPRKLSIGERIKKVSTGGGNATWLFLTEDGRVLVSGLDILMFRRLEDFNETVAYEAGLGDTEFKPIITAEPGYTEANLPFRCTDISCGMVNYSVLSEEGEVYVLGTLLGDYDRRAANLTYEEPYRIAFPERIIGIESGSHFVAGLSESGNVYLYGKKDGVFFDEAHDRELSENLFLKGGLREIRSISCFLYCTLAIDKNGDLWGFGIDQRGALDVRNTDADPSTYEIIREPRRLNYSGVVFCDTTVNDSVILTEDGRYFVQGEGTDFLNKPFEMSE